MRATAAAVAVAGMVVVVVLAQPGGSSKARADSTAPLAPAGPGAPDCCPHTHARAQALLKPNGSLVRKTGIASATHVAPGTYCIGLDPTIPVASTTPVVTQDISLSQSPSSMPVSVAIASSAPDCPPASNSIEVMTFAEVGGQRAPTDEAFTIVVA